MKLTGLECPSCGAKLSVNEQNPTQAVCEYCGSTFAVEWDHDQAYFDRSGQDKTPKTPEKRLGERRMETQYAGIGVGSRLFDSSQGSADL